MSQYASHLEIQTDNGHLKRVTLDSPLLSLAEAAEITRTLSSAMADFQPKQSSDLHLTILHIGQPEALWAEITQSGVALDFKDFFELFMRLLERIENLIAEPFWLEVESIAEFGNPSEPVIVLHLENGHWLNSRRDHALTVLVEMLVACGVAEPLVFIDKSFNLHHQLPQHFKPHVSLGRLPHDQKLPNIEVSGLKLNFGPSKLRNVEHR